MRLSQFSDYAIRVLIFAALKEDAFQIEEVSVAYGISRHHLAKIVQELSKLGYLNTRRGRGGGIQLARKPEEIRIGCLLRMTEDHTLVECFDASTSTCRLDGCCKLKAALARAQGAFYDSLDEHTLRDFVTGSQHHRMVKALLPK